MFLCHYSIAINSGCKWILKIAAHISHLRIFSRTNFISHFFFFFSFFLHTHDVCVKVWCHWNFWLLCSFLFSQINRFDWRHLANIKWFNFCFLVEIAFNFALRRLNFVVVVLSTSLCCGVCNTWKCSYIHGNFSVSCELQNFTFEFGILYFPSIFHTYSMVVCAYSLCVFLLFFSSFFARYLCRLWISVVEIKFFLVVIKKFRFATIVDAAMLSLLLTAAMEHYYFRITLSFIMNLWN